jgi:hypothetical protein
MKTEEIDDGLVGASSPMLRLSLPPRPDDGSSPFPILVFVTLTDGSSNWPAGVRRRPPSGLKVSRRKKLVKLSSPYRRTEDHALAGIDRMAGSAGIGDGERPYRPVGAGEPGALIDERREDAAISIEGGNMVAVVTGVLATEAEGVAI